MSTFQRKSAISFGVTAQSNGKPLPTKKSNPCPVCGDTGGKCRTFAHEPIVLCGNEHSGEVGGYRFVKPSKNSLWSVFAPVDGESNSDDWRRRLEDRERANRLKVLVPVQRKPVADRDKEYRFERATLRTSRRENLKARGLTDEEINWAISHHWLWDKGAGFAIAALSLNGLIQGCQVARDDRSLKYLWDSKDGSGQLPGSGEMPIAYWMHPDCDLSKPIKIIACDAFLKGLVAGIKHWRTGDFQTVFIGAPGCNFQPIQLKSLLETLNPVSVTYAPDAGDVENPGMMRAIATFAERCTAMGYEPDVIWWEQIAKSEKDLDDLSHDEYESAQRLTFAKFLELASNSESGQGFAAIQGSGEGHASERDRLIARKDFKFAQALQLLIRDYKLTHDPEQGRDICYYERHTPEFSGALLDAISTIFVSGWLAAGKTYAAIESIRRFIEAVGTGKQIVWISGRNGLLRQTEQRLLRVLESLGFPVYFFQDDVYHHRQLLETGQPGIFIFTDEGFSDYHVGQIDWSNIIVFVDEWAGMRAEVVGKSIMPEFERMLSGCKTLVVLDAFMGDVDCQVLSKYRTGDRLILDQVADKAPKRIGWIETFTKLGDISFSHDGVAFQVLDQWFPTEWQSTIGENERYVVVTDSLLTAKAIQTRAIALGVPESQILLISSETPEEARKFLGNPDDRILSSGARLVIMTPTAQAGIDIQVPFTAGLAMFCGVIPGTQALQLIGRARQCNDWLVSAPRRAIDGDVPTMSEAKIKRCLERLSQALEEAGVTTGRSDDWAFRQREIRAIQAQFNSEFIHHLLIEHYASVETVELANPHLPAWKEMTQSIKALEAKKMLEASKDNGLRMLAQQKQPQHDHEVWDLKLAEEYTKYPEVYEAAIAAYRSGDIDAMESALTGCKTFINKNQMGALRRYLRAIDANVEDDLDLRDRCGNRFTNYATGHFRELQNQELFRSLNLEGLARLGRGSSEQLAPHENAYEASSLEVEARWEQFSTNPRLVRLFPTVETLKDFWGVLKGAMRYFGFQSANGTARVESAQPIPNGRDRNGRQRFSNSQSRYFVGWLCRAESGVKFFRENFSMIVGAVRDRLEAERLERRDREAHTQAEQQVEAAAGQAWEAAAA